MNLDDFLRGSSSSSSLSQFFLLVLSDMGFVEANLPPGPRKGSFTATGLGREASDPREQRGAVGGFLCDTIAEALVEVFAETL